MNEISSKKSEKGWNESTIRTNAVTISVPKTEFYTVMIICENFDPLYAYDKYSGSAEIQAMDRKYDSKDILALYEKLKPDLVVLDLDKPHHDCLSVLEGIRQLNSSAKIVPLIGFSENIFLVWDLQWLLGFISPFTCN